MTGSPEMQEQKTLDHGRSHASPSLAWPILLIGAGVILLLANLGRLPGSAGFWLSRLWPLVLIVMGIDILTGPRARWLSALLALALVTGVIILLLFGPPLPFLDPAAPPAGEPGGILFALRRGH